MTGEIQPQQSLNNLRDQLKEVIPTIENTEYILIYNPDKWVYDVFYFLNDLSNLNDMNGSIYTILHVSY